ncbi:MAG: cell wall-binding repeat-containing protein [Nocardioidaceae bacterium]|nr:cell wall-binding repeat-containing protein [Nocardioidaceae bacterium]
MTPTLLRRTAVTGAAAVLGLGAALAGAPSFADGATADSSRLSGPDRYATAAAAFDDLMESRPADDRPNTAVLASGEDFPDALSASYLAGVLDDGKGVGVLLTRRGSLPAITLRTLRENRIQVVFVVGGPAVVSERVVGAVQTSYRAGSDDEVLTTRVAGRDRYETNAVAVREGIDQQYRTEGVTRGRVLLASGRGFADALAAAPLAYANHVPLVLTRGTSAGLVLGGPARRVSGLDVVGTTDVVSDAAARAAAKAAQVPTYTRIGGADRTQTARLVAEHARTTSPYAAEFSGTRTLAVVNGSTFPDAVAAGAWAGSARTPLLLTRNGATLGPGLEAYARRAAGGIDHVVALGGDDVLPDARVQQIISLLTPAGR